MLLEDLLRSCGCPDGENLELAQEAAAALLDAGLDRAAILAWIDQVFAQPDRFLSDSALAPLAHARLRRQLQEH